MVPSSFDWDYGFFLNLLKLQELTWQKDGTGRQVAGVDPDHVRRHLDPTFSAFHLKESSGGNFVPPTFSLKK